MGVINVMKLREERDYHVIERTFLKINDESKKFKVTKIEMYKVYCIEDEEDNFCINAMEYVAKEINKSEGREDVRDKAEAVIICTKLRYIELSNDRDEILDKKEVVIDLDEDDYIEQLSTRIHYNSNENMIDYISIEGFQEPVNCVIIDENTRFYKEEDSKDDYERIWMKDYNVDFHKEV